MGFSSSRRAAVFVATLFALATPSAAQAGSSCATTGLDDAEKAMLARVNSLRKEQGLKPLKADIKLRSASDVHTDDMLANQFFDHPSSDGTSPAKRIRKYVPEAKAIGENLGRLTTGSSINEELDLVVQVWLDQAMERKNLFNSKFTRIGIGRKIGPFDDETEALYTVTFADGSCTPPKKKGSKKKG